MKLYQYNTNAAVALSVWQQACAMLSNKDEEERQMDDQHKTSQ